MALLICAGASIGFFTCARAEPRDYFRIVVTDADRGRGVPLVELKTTNDLRFHTDSKGLVAINEPD